MAKDKEARKGRGRSRRGRARLAGPPAAIAGLMATSLLLGLAAIASGTRRRRHERRAMPWAVLAAPLSVALALAGTLILAVGGDRRGRVASAARDATATAGDTAATAVDAVRGLVARRQGAHAGSHDLAPGPGVTRDGGDRGPGAVGAGLDPGD